MKKILWFALALLVFLTAAEFAAPSARAQAQSAAPPSGVAATPGTAAPAPPQGRKKRVAIFDFDFATVQTSSAAVFGQNVDIGKGISDLLVKYLVQDGTYSVIERKALVNIDARIVDIDTAEILGVASGHGESKRESTGLAGMGGGWTGGGGGAVDFGTSDFQQTIIGEAVNAAVQQMSTGIITDNTKL